MIKLISGLFGAAIVFSCSTAGATPPERVEVLPFYGYGQYIGDCGDFAILSDYSGSGHTMFHFDKIGNITKQFDHFNYESIYYNSKDSSIALRGSGEVENLKWNYIGDPPTLAVAGTSFQLTVPHYGVVINRTGRLVFDLNTWELSFQSGPFMFGEGEFEAVCAALAQ